MNIDLKTAIYILTPFILIGVAWGTSTAKINDLSKENELIKSKVEKVQVMEVEVRYIKEQVNRNSNKLDKILEKMQ
jgi:outer membrane murein-binding lipoprotein Lpp|tara:strand:+ start:272 stop:499 length:228 start_codon:yes stop_codon:yes gene_type:complete